MLYFIVNWSTTETLLSVGELGKPESVIESKGEPSEERVQVGHDGVVVRLGSEGIQVASAVMFSNGRQVLKPTAIETWHDTLEAIRIVQQASSDEGHFFEIVSGNLCIVMLTTGYEAYCKDRFLELEEEGIVPNFDALVRRFTSESERNKGLPDDLKAEALARSISPLRHFVQSRRIDFQNFRDCNRAFTKAWSLNFGTQLGLPNTTFEFVQQAIKYRHRIVHVSPTWAVLNMDRTTQGEPISANRAFVAEASRIFDEFIQALHAGSLRLKIGGFTESADT